MNRGDVFSLPPPRRARGREQRGARYAVILQSERFELLSTVIVAPTSASATPASFRPRVTVAGAATSVMVEQLQGIDPERLGDRVGRLGWEEMEEIASSLRLLLAL